MALASDLATVLESLGYGVWGGGTTPGASLFLDHEPDAPAVCTTLYFPGGPPDTLDLNGNSYGECPALIRMRDSDPVALRTRLGSLYTLWTPWNTYVAFSLRVKAATKPLYLYPQDQNNNFIASFNITCIQGS